MSIADVLEGAARYCLIEGDCREVLPTLGDKAVAHVITDPPYEAEAHTKQRRSSRAPRGGKEKFVSFPIEFDAMDSATRAICAAEFGRLCRRWALVFCQLEGAKPWRDAAAPGLRHVRTCVWVKPDGSPQFTGDRPGTGYECFEVLHVPGPTRWNAGGKRGVYTFNCGSQVRDPALDHQTPKPEDLMLALVRDFTDPGDVILDPFTGGGTTGVAALRLGRRFIGIERNPKYVELARLRLEAELDGSTLKAARAGQTALFGAAR